MSKLTPILKNRMVGMMRQERASVLSRIASTVVSMLSPGGTATVNHRL